MSDRRGWPASSCRARIHHERSAAQAGADGRVARPRQRGLCSLWIESSLRVTPSSHYYGFGHDYSAAVGCADTELTGSSPAATTNTLCYMRAILQSAGTPNHGLQPLTGVHVTACAADRHHLSTHRHRPRQPPPSLSLGSLGHYDVLLEIEKKIAAEHASRILSARA